jgi:hypothetical protein
MAFTIYDASVPVFIRMLGNMSMHLERAEAHAQAKKFDSKNLISCRLAPDMLPLARQVTIACDTAKLAVARLSGVEAPKFEDTEQTIEELKARIQKTVAFLQSVPKDKLDGADTREVTWPVRGQPLTLPGAAYFLQHATPNFYFHYTTCYAILRHNGVELGKTDYLRGLGS